MKGFTLIEIIITITVIGILLGVTSNLGRERFAMLDAQKNIQSMVNDYNSIRRDLLGSSYYQGQTTTAVRMSFFSGSSQYQIAQQTISGEVITTGLIGKEITTVFPLATGASTISITMLPYQIPCTASVPQPRIQFLGRGISSPSCFSIDTRTCKGQLTRCK